MNYQAYPILITLLAILVTPVARAQNEIERIRVRDVVADPESVTDRLIHLSGVLSVLKDDSVLWDPTNEAVLDAWVDFDEGYQQRSPKSAIRKLTKLRRKSGTSYPHRGSSVIQLNYRPANVILEGVLKANQYLLPERPQVQDGKIELLGDPITRRNSCRYVFLVRRIVELRERGARANTAPNSGVQRGARVGVRRDPEATSRAR